VATVLLGSRAARSEALPPRGRGVSIEVPNSFRPRQQLCALILCLTSCVLQGGADPGLQFASAGQTAYVIVGPDHASTVDAYAVRTLADCLQRATGATFPVLTPAELREQPMPTHIFVGQSSHAEDRFGAAALIDGLSDQGHAARTRDTDILLCGRGLHGNFYAVQHFMESALGWRWFSRFEKPVIPVRRDLIIAPPAWTREVAFAYRQGLWFVGPFDYHNGINIRLSERDTEYRARRGTPRFAAGIVSHPDGWTISGVHALDQLIPATPATRLWPPYQWLKKRDYFKTHPAFFTLQPSGRRVPNQQLCFSHAPLRQELTRNIRGFIREHGAHTPVVLGAADASGGFCACAGCKALARRYQSPGGPYYDYLIEIATLLAKESPDTRIKALAYRRSQTQRPPKMPTGERLPDNVLVVFASVEDPLNVSWDSAVGRETYADLRGWCGIARHVLTWHYPVPYSKGAHFPFSNIRRLSANLRLAKQAGAEGVYQEYATDRVNAGYDFAELHIYLFYKLAMDVTADVAQLVREFTDHQYGDAAHLARTYLDELEAAVAASPQPVPMSATSESCFAYLTAARIHRWQALFDRMVIRLADTPRELANVRRLRRNLDVAVLLRWFDLAQAHPKAYEDHRDYTRRILAAGGGGKGVLQDLVAVIQGGGQKLPLPAPFAELDPSRVRRFVPENKGRGPKAAKQRYVRDRAAAFGYAATVHREIDRDLPFAFGFYQNRVGATAPPWGTAGARRELGHDLITADTYQVYRLGTIRVTPSCRIWLQVNQGQATTLELGPRLFDVTAPDGPTNVWDAHVSLKFTGPAYGGGAGPNRVLCDQIILVRNDGG
jgi:hypothetical protein